MARTRVDLLPVTWHQLNVSAFNRVWIKLGFGVQARARRSTLGFDLRIRYGTNDVIQKSRVEVREVPWRAGKQLRPTLVCSVCSKPTTKILYLGSDFRFSCAKCLGVPSWKIRMPMQWDLGEEVRFRRLLKRKLDQDILQFELAALRSLSPEQFFASRPYLVPTWVDRVRDLDAALHSKLLRVIHGKYRSVMMRRRVVFLNEREDEWLMDELLKVFGKSTIITKKEITWLKNRHATLRSSDYDLMKSEGSPLQSSSLNRTSLMSSPKSPTLTLLESGEAKESLRSNETQDGQPGPSGSQPGSTLETSSSQLSEIGCLLLKIASGRAMTAESAPEKEPSDATNATARDGTTEIPDQTLTRK